MPRYLVSYAEPDGKAVTKRLAADTARGLRELLESQGKLDVVLHDDDLTASMKDEDGWTRHLNPAAEELKLQTPEGSLANTRWGLRSLGLGLAAVVVLWSSLRPPINFWTFTGILSAVLLLVMAAGSLLSRLFADFQHARVWRRWDELERLMFWIRQINRFTRLKVLTNEMLLLESVMCVARGDLQAGLQRFEILRETSGWSEAVLLGRKTALYDAAHDRGAMLDCSREAYERSGEDTTNHIDYAMALAAYARDPDKAEQVLNSRQAATLLPHARTFMKWTRAQIALERAQFDTAQVLFREAIAEADAARDPVSWEGPRLGMEVGLGLALAEAGDPSGREHLTRTMPFVLADGDPVLVARCQAALGAS